MFIKYIWFGLVVFLLHINHCILFNVKYFLYIYIYYIYIAYMIYFGWILWHINQCKLFKPISSLYTHTHTHIYIYTWFGYVGFYGISTIVGFLMPNPVHTYISNRYNLGWFYGILPIINYLMPNPHYTYISNIYDLVGLVFMAYQSL